MRERSESEERIMVTPPGYDSQGQGGGGLSGGLDAASLGLAATQPILLPSNDGQYQDQAQLESDKRAVYKHPLFPLLALLFEKCEMATRTSADSPFSDSFHQDFEAFVQHQERDRKPFLLNEPEVDGLMIKAIQVLRIHLLEMDKVQELCKDFCTRYITCLKGKMQSENLLRSDYFDGGGGIGGGGASFGGASLSSNSNSPHHSSFSSNGDFGSGSPPLPINNNFLHNPSTLHQPFPPYSPSSVSPEENSLPPHPLPVESGIHGGTPLSQIGANSCPPQPPSSNSGSGLGLHDQFDNSPGTGSSAEEDDQDYPGRKKPKRGVLPKQATSIMRSWLFQHIVHPYPTEDEKRQIAAQTNLTLLQVNNWFINARRRILQPMLDASNPGTPTPPKVKKLKPNGSSKSRRKFWSGNRTSSGDPGQAQGEEDNNPSGESESDESSNSNSNPAPGPDQHRPDRDPAQLMDNIDDDEDSQSQQ